jgi:hypothetical protein
VVLEFTRILPDNPTLQNIVVHLSVLANRAIIQVMQARLLVRNATGFTPVDAYIQPTPDFLELEEAAEIFEIFSAEAHRSGVVGEGTAGVKTAASVRQLRGVGRC